MTYGPPFSGINLPETAPLQGISGYGLSDRPRPEGRGFYKKL